MIQLLRSIISIYCHLGNISIAVILRLPCVFFILSIKTSNQKVKLQYCVNVRVIKDAFQFIVAQSLPVNGAIFFPLPTKFALLPPGVQKSEATLTVLNLCGVLCIFYVLHFEPRATVASIRFAKFLLGLEMDYGLPFCSCF